jgi:hypothetical protein
MVLKTLDSLKFFCGSELSMLRIGCVQSPCNLENCPEDDHKVVGKRRFHLCFCLGAIYPCWQAENFNVSIKGLPDADLSVLEKTGSNLNI